MTRKHVIVSGEVQGVCFRAACRTTAAANGVRGWVRNLPDHTVEAVFEGAHDAVERLVGWAHEGPPAAFVGAVRVREEAPQGLTGFEIRPTPPTS